MVGNVLEATLDEMARVGYAALSFDSVAARAGVSRTTVYRRWPTKADLVRAAVLALMHDEPLPADTGSLREDLLELLSRTFAGSMPRDVALLRGVMTAATDPDVAALTRLARAHREERYFIIVDRAIRRGELPADTPPRLVIEPLMAVIYFRMCVFDETTRREDLEQLVDLVVAGARGRIASNPRAS